MAGRVSVSFLGTGSTVPSKERAHPAIVVSFEGENILFDCGEGTQVRIQEAGINPMKIEQIFITHFHPDHFLGLPGLLSSLELYGRKARIEIYSPKAASEKLQRIVRLSDRKPKFPTKFIPVKLSKGPLEIFKGEKYSIFSCKTFHHTPSVGYSFVENERLHLVPDKLPEKLRGKTKEYSKIPLPKKGGPFPEYFTAEKGIKITYGGDTKYCQNLVNLAKDSDLLIHEATFPEDNQEKAEEYFHSTPLDAARVAREAGAKKLALVHFSRRVTDVSLQEASARKIFPNSFSARDLEKIEV